MVTSLVSFGSLLYTLLIDFHEFHDALVQNLMQILRLTFRREGKNDCA